MTRSLRRTLLAWLVPILLFATLVGALIAYTVAVRAANTAYDRALLDSAMAIAAQVRREGPRLVLPLPAAAQDILLTDRYDKIYYEVRDSFGDLVAGHSGLPRPTQPPGSGPLYYDGWYDGRPVRVAALYAPIEVGSALVLVAETTVKRKGLVREILLALVTPVLVLAGLGFALLTFAIRRGLKPIDALQRDLGERSHQDLRPLSVAQVPSELQPMMQEINALFARLSAALAAQRSFIGDAAHQLRTPIAALLAQAELAMQPPPSPEDMQRMLLGIRRLSHLAHQLLALARAEPDWSEPFARADLDALIRGLAESWVDRAEEKGIDLGFDLSPAPLSGSALWLEEMLSNLLDNALSYTPRGGSVTVRCGEGSDGAWVSVEDSGPGIPEAERGRVPQRFYRIPGTAGEGCGLGLAIVDEVVRHHGGTLAIDESPAHGGARITVRFPPS